VVREFQKNRCVTIVALTRRRQCAPTTEISSAKSGYSRQDLFAPFYEMRSGPGWVGTSDIFIGQFTLDPGPAESNRLFGSILLELEGIAEDGRAIYLDRVGWHAPTGRAPQLDALGVTLIVRRISLPFLQRLQIPGQQLN
jgi:hypothetical protein